MRSYVGIDPGKKGGVCTAFFSEEGKFLATEIEKIPLNVEMFREMLRQFPNPSVVVEKQWLRKTDAHDSRFIKLQCLLENYYMVCHVLSLERIRHEAIAAVTWQGTFDLVHPGQATTEKKNDHKARAREQLVQWGYSEKEAKKEAIHDTSDAILICAYAVANFKESQTEGAI